MAYYNPEPKFEHGDQLKVGILLANLGTPDAPTAQLYGLICGSF